MVQAAGCDPVYASSILVRHPKSMAWIAYKANSDSPDSIIGVFETVKEADAKGDYVAEACGKGYCSASPNPQTAPHTCPYLSDVHEDRETLCNCCEFCQACCADEI